MSAISHGSDAGGPGAALPAAPRGAALADDALLAEIAEEAGTVPEVVRESVRALGRSLTVPVDRQCGNRGTAFL